MAAFARLHFARPVPRVITFQPNIGTVERVLAIVDELLQTGNWQLGFATSREQ
ncbi:MAG: hypothetical protein ACJ8C4_04275 [Gemmataceae bacterium]